MRQEATDRGRLSQRALQGPTSRGVAEQRPQCAAVLLGRLSIDTGPLQNRAYGIGWLGPVVDPMSRPIEIDVDRGRVGDGIVEANRLDKGPITGRAAVSGDDA